MIDYTYQFVHCEVHNAKGNITNWMTIIYAHNQLHNRKKLLMDLKNHAMGIQGPWIVLGDLNNVFDVWGDRIGGNNVQEAEYTDLGHMMEEVELYKHETIGNYFTWSNGMIYSRIDRVVHNR